MEMQKVYIRGKKLQNLLMANGITQAEISQIIGIDASTLSKMIRGKALMPVSMIESICDLLQINPKEIIDEIKDTSFTCKSVIIPDCKWNDEFFRKQLKQKNLTIAQLSELIKRDKTIYSTYKLGKASPSMETVKRIVAALECSTKDLIGVSEDKLNEIAGYKMFTEKDHDTQTEISASADSTTIAVPHCFAEESVYDYKHFENQNVIENMNIINENILLLVKNITDYKDSFEDKMSCLIAANENLLERIETLEKRNMINVAAQPKTKSVTLWGNNHCSEKELKEIVNSAIISDDCNTYKQKIYKIINYISKKKHLTFNQILHDNYNQFSRVYGFNYDELKKESGANTTLDAVYENPLCREIFFNMVCKNATENV